ncbi:MAG: HIT domain-containing protein [Nitrososphaeria archaeon]
MDGCIFCRILSGELKGYFVYRDQYTAAFLDAYPLAEGHTLVVPLRHVQRFQELSEEEACALSMTLLKVSKAISKALGASSLTIGINDGPDAGQVVPHLHVHVVPRWRGDGGSNLHSIFRGARRPERVSMDEIAMRISSSIERLYSADAMLFRSRRVHIACRRSGSGSWTWRAARGPSTSGGSPRAGSAWW